MSHSSHSGQSELLQLQGGKDSKVFVVVSGSEVVIQIRDVLWL